MSLNELVEAFEINLANQFFDLAKDTLKLLPNDIASKLEQRLPKLSSMGLKGSCVDWEFHYKFGLAGNCFVCRRAFTRAESKMMGIGPVCGGWSYSFDPRDPANKEKLEELMRNLRNNMLSADKGYKQYRDLTEGIPKVIGRKAIIGIVRETAKAILVDVNGISQYWMPKKSCVYYFGAFFVQLWKAREILNDLAVKMNGDLKK